MSPRAALRVLTRRRAHIAARLELHDCSKGAEGHFRGELAALEVCIEMLEAFAPLPQEARHEEEEKAREHVRERSVHCTCKRCPLHSLGVG